jgi:hypothetical protein
MTMNKTNIAMVLDRSGSMSTCQQETIDSVNLYLKEARADAGLKQAPFDLVIFDSESIDTIRSGSVQDTKDITVEDFVPRGCTPLYDAIGRGIDSLDAKGGERSVLVVVTDGMENASRKHNHQSIAELIKAKQAAGWLIVFLAAGLEAARQGIGLGVNAGTVANIGLSAANLGAVACNTVAMTQSYDCALDHRAYASTASFSAKARQAMGDADDSLAARVRKPKAAKPALSDQDDAFTTSSGDAWTGRA